MFSETFFLISLVFIIIVVVVIITIITIPSTIQMLSYDSLSTSTLCSTACYRRLLTYIHPSAVVPYVLNSHVFLESQHLLQTEHTCRRYKTCIFDLTTYLTEKHGKRNVTHSHTVIIYNEIIITKLDYK